MSYVNLLYYLALFYLPIFGPFKQQYNFYNKSMWKNVHPIYSTGIRTHDLLDPSLLTQPLDQM